MTSLENTFVFPTDFTATPEKENYVLIKNPTLEDTVFFSNGYSPNAGGRRSPLRPSTPNRRPQSATKQSRNLPQKPPLPNKIEIFVRCDELPKMDAFSNSDPICVLYVKRYGQWREYGRTECIPNCHKPKFAETFILDTKDQDNQCLKFSVFDSENLTSKDLHKHKLIGAVEIDLFVLVTKSDSLDGYELQFQSQKSKRGKIYITAEEVCEHARSTNIKLCLSALKLSKKGLNIFGKCDAFFELERKLKNDMFHPVYRSEVIFRNSEPRWKPFEISMQRLCNGSRESHIMITVYNFQSKGDHACIGFAETSYAGMTKRIGDVKTLPLRKGQLMRSFSTDSKRGRQDSLGKAMIRILQCVPEERFSLVDYVKGGCIVNFAAAIDFSSSNGRFDEQNSLHSLDDVEVNVYEEALHSIGSWLAYYDSRSHYEMYGFAGIVNGNKDNTSCFPMKQTGVKRIPVGGPSPIEELVYIYRSYLQYVELSGPTLLKPVIEMIKDNLVKEVSQEKQHFTLALILTDGVSNDMQELLESITSCSEYPISFIVACLGPLRMETLHYFNVLSETVRKQCHRELIYAIAFCETNIDVSLQLTRSIFAKLSKDIVQYFAIKGIKPKQTSVHSSSDLHDQKQNEFSSGIEDPLRSAEYDNRLNFIKDVTSFCPTCGSHANNRPGIPDVNI